MMERILGIDPGLATTGFGVLDVDKNITTAVTYGCITTLPGENSAARLLSINQDLKKIIAEYKPTVAACEELFFAANTKTALAVGQARGAILLTIGSFSLPVHEYTPLQVKQALTGYGRADKSQIQQMVKTLLHLNTIPTPDDAADALAIAICCAHSLSLANIHV